MSAEPGGSWNPVSKAAPCPVCGHPEGCEISDDSKLVRCRRVDHGPTLKAPLRNGAGWLHILGGRKPALRAYRPPTAPSPRRAAIDLLHRVYAALLRLLPLSDAHRAHLRGPKRQFTDAQIERHGYRTLPLRGRAAACKTLLDTFDRADLLTVPGFYLGGEGEKQYLTLAGPPGILCPVRDEEGRIAGLQVRSDKNGKYCWLSSKKRGGPGPGGEDGLPAAVFRPLEIKDRRVWVTEGVPKGAICADYLGASFVAVPGVGTWEGCRVISRLRALGAKAVVVAYDADKTRKPAVQQAERSLLCALVAAGFAVEVAVWDEGAGKGIDDLLLNGGTPKFAPWTEPPPAADAPPLPWPYGIEDGRFGYYRDDRDDDPIFFPLANFTARIAEDLVVDDGATQTRAFVVEGTLEDGTPLSPAHVPADRFAAMDWLAGAWGARATLKAGPAVRDRVRECIQSNGPPPKERRVFAHLGWRKIDNRRVFLHAGSTAAEVALSPPLDSYCLPESPEDLVGAVRASEALLDVAPRRLTVPLFTCVYLAPLYECIRPDFALWLDGPTGTRKTTMAQLFLCHFGNFLPKANIPGSWESTANALERTLHAAKDVLVLIDDYAPRADAATQARMAGHAQRVIRSIGNHAARGRLGPDALPRPEYRPRGLAVMTGEDLPPGQSILARLLSLSVEPGDVNLPALSAAQATADRLRHAMAGYIAWLQPQLDELAPQLQDQRLRYRDHYTASGCHGRGPEILSFLRIGLELFAAFAEEAGAFSRAERLAFLEEVEPILLALGQTHAETVRTADPAEVFLETLGALLASGRAVLAPRNGALPECPVIGWRDDLEGYGFLIPGEARRAVTEYLRQSGSHFPFTDKPLFAALDRKGALVRGPDGKATVPRRLSGKRQRVLQIPIHHLEPTEAEEGEPNGL